MFITDLDGTLFNDEKRINPLDLQSLKRLGDMGIIRVFATGRSLYSFQQAVEKNGFYNFCEDMPVDYLICSTGACIIKCNADNGSNNCKIIKKHSLTSEDVSRIATYFDTLKLDYMIHRPVPDSHYCLYKQQSQSLSLDFKLRIEIYKDFIKPINYLGAVRDFGESTEVLTIVPYEDGHKTADMIELALSEFSVVRATSPLNEQFLWIEIFNKSVSKSQAVSWLAKELDVKQQEVVAVGNDYNDLDMLKWAGHSFVVRNAPQMLKDKFTSRDKLMEVASNNDCGVSEAINSLGIKI